MAARERYILLWSTNSHRHTRTHKLESLPLPTDPTLKCKSSAFCPVEASNAAALLIKTGGLATSSVPFLHQDRNSRMQRRGRPATDLLTFYRDELHVPPILVTSKLGISNATLNIGYILFGIGLPCILLIFVVFVI